MKTFHTYQRLMTPHGWLCFLFALLIYQNACYGKVGPAVPGVLPTDSLSAISNDSSWQAEVKDLSGILVSMKEPKLTTALCSKPLSLRMVYMVSEKEVYTMRVCGDSSGGRVVRKKKMPDGTPYLEENDVLNPSEVKTASDLFSLMGIDTIARSTFSFGGVGILLEWEFNGKYSFLYRKTPKLTKPDDYKLMTFGTYLAGITKSWL